MLQPGSEFVGDRVAGAARPRTLRVPTLDHEAVNHPVEDHAVVESLFCQIDEVLRRLGREVGEELDLEGPHIGLEHRGGTSLGPGPPRQQQDHAGQGQDKQRNCGRRFQNRSQNRCLPSITGFR